MALNADQAYWVSEQPSTIRRVKFFVTKAATAVMAEDAQTASHAERVVFAKTVLDGTYSASNYSLACLANSTIQAAGDAGASPLFGIVDGDLEFTVNSLFNAMAGVST